MAFEIIDLVVSIIILILGFSVFTALVNDYRVVITVSRVIRKKVKVSAFRELALPIYPSLMKIEIINARSLTEGIDVEVHGNTIKIINNKGIIGDSDVRIIIDAVVTGRLGDYPVRGMVVLSPY
ncbi:hypothetical protein [Vulcanisaeta souniana]|uniref:Uncharacterized protein n=1 Tax=Vulcanisaeta souniana JCM 11219 TaxID=1293586 RepID=A0A830E3Y8_9CREN|nr:hypothetical protein [Vulcanisaeta souniana]BDR92059.1 hypothetical protein Vsou_11520 [Vulcanisaeta souniana JCM 11219]GGI68188.1 hypothetical protein GCM10007112_01550 [Vulcanisaeta souniana JCM 11219]